MQTQAPTTTVQARNLRKGATLVDLRCNALMPVLRVLECADGSIRVFTPHGEQRMTACLPVRVLH